ncbi:UPF0488 protein C8orf33 homolog [Nelusetta ayraudi]|uniref:UPF0488 protein C8orf33 homolog n=1 Tax=Nelusetta ayraudi TaxID=303726 RepID=UPI003F6FB509
MSDRSLIFIDIKPKSNGSASLTGNTDKPLWSNSNNSFKFNFLPDNVPTLAEESFLPSESPEAAKGQISFTGQGSFTFGFQIPSAVPVEHMDTTETPQSPSLVQEEQPSMSQDANPPEAGVQSKGKKKKKSGKKKPVDDTASQQESAGAEGSQGGKDTELSAEEQLNRQLDWCIEQLELGMKSLKATPKQKEEASRALKTLRSSKAPLVKKRQVMRAMAGDYRKKMEDESKKQYKLIQSEVASAQVKTTLESPKKCVFHRRAVAKPQTSATGEQPQQPDSQMTSQDAKPFVFTSSKEDFHFNFF